MWEAIAFVSGLVVGGLAVWGFKRWELYVTTKAQNDMVKYMNKSISLMFKDSSAGLPPSGSGKKGLN